jgi:hypothetical protein
VLTETKARPGLALIIYEKMTRGETVLVFKTAPGPAYFSKYARLFVWSLWVVACR